MLLNINKIYVGVKIKILAILESVLCCVVAEVTPPLVYTVKLVYTLCLLAY